MLEPEVTRAQAYLLSSQRPFSWFANLATMTALSVALWPRHSHTVILMWCAANYLLAGLRILDWRDFVRSQPTDPVAINAWLNRFTRWTFLGGLIWGVSAFAFLTGELLSETVLLVAVYLGIGFGAITAFSAHYPSLAATIVPLLVPPAMVLLSFPDRAFNILGGLLLLYLVIVLFFGRNYNRMILRSITLDLENSQLLQEVTQAKDRAESASREKSNFLAAMSHDLRQPLYAMGLYLEAIDRNQQSPRDYDLLEHVDHAFDSLDAMFKALIEISQLDAGAIRPKLAHLAVEPMFRQLVEEVRGIARNKGVEITYKPSDAVVYSDGILLVRMLRNLLSNAIKYTDEGAVTIEATALASSVVISVTDSGQGIPDDRMTDIFSEYVQLGNHERDRSKGLGLGLAVVKRSAELLKHEISVQSTLGQGSKFSLSVARGEANEIEAGELDITPLSVAGLHILLVDDDEPIRRGMEILLSDHDCVVTTAASASDALQALQTNPRPPDVLVCDYRLRDDQTGFQAVEQIRAEIDAELPAVIVTGDTDAGVRRAAEERDLYLLHKPVKLAQLNKVISEIT